MSQKLTIARQAYSSTAQSSLVELITNIAKLVTDLPGRNIIVDTQRHRLYVNTETQTEEHDDSLSADSKNNVDTETTSEQQALHSIAETLNTAGQKAEEEEYLALSGKLSDLHTYLQDLESYGYKAINTAYSSGDTKNNGGASEAVQKVKAEIRSVKGSLLNARTFQHANTRSATEVKAS